MTQKEMTRREFLKNAGIVAGAAAGGSLLLSSCATTGAAASTLPETWDYEADIVVIGMGGAGACAAIEAYDAGAKVLVLEKQAEDHHFPNTRMSGGVWHNPVRDGDPAALKEYIKSMMSGENLPWKFEGEMEDRSEAMATMFASGILEIQDFLLKQAPGLDPAAMTPGGDASFPMFPAFGAGKYGRTVSTRFKDYQNADQDQRTYQRPTDQTSNGEAFFRALVYEGIKSKRPGIQRFYETPAKDLIRDPVDGRVKGVVATTKDGREIKVKAARAVVLTSGGFEYSVKMRRAFLEGPGVKGWGFYGSPDNTGDGIEMAIKIGAALVKVAKSASRIEPAFPVGVGYEKTGLKMGTSQNITSNRNSIVVDNYGSRYTDEYIITDSTRPYRYQFYKEAVHYDMLTMCYPRVPSWVIFDETARARGPVVSGGTVQYDFVKWDNDNMNGINAGWIHKGNTIEELVEKIKADPENRELIDVNNVRTAIQQFNEYCAKGVDEQFGRAISTMAPVEKPPYYAMKLYPGGPNTKGGIDADENRQVYDWEGRPIAGLFSAGEISSVFKFVYQAGGNITECVVCGRKAGQNAAAQRPWA
ncbi:MAG: FAD-dependent oxidoreductase [Treponema sp.]|nr:FAD-dependent oxidoreductase [Treponema sp.]